MSIEALTWARKQQAGNAGRKAVLMNLADRADEAHSCWPTQELIAEETELSVRAVRDHLAELERMGLIAQRMKRYKKDGKRTSDRYILPVSVAVGVHYRQDPPPADSAATVTALPAESAGSEQELPADSAATTGRICRQTLIEPSQPPTGVDAPAREAEAPKPKRVAVVGARIPDDWRRSDSDRAWQVKQGIPDEFARPVTGEFLNYWLAATGRTATKRDWSAAWKQWMSREWREKGPRWLRDHAPDEARRQQARGRAARPFDALAAAR